MKRANLIALSCFVILSSLLYGFLYKIEPEPDNMISEVSNNEIINEQKHREINHKTSNINGDLFKASSVTSENVSFVFSGSTMGTLRDMTNIDVYMFMTRYSHGIVRKLTEKGYKPARLLFPSLIDPQNTGDFNRASIREHLNRTFSLDDTTLLIIDWEKEHYLNLKLPRSSEKFLAAEKQFIDLIDFIKEQRPNLRVGVYGLPFWVFVNRYPAYGGKDKFKNILERCDVITPAYYARSLDKDIGQEKNDFYVENNLDITFEYANQLNKPVIPFVWEFVHPVNKTRGGTLIGKDEFGHRLRNIVSYTNQGNRVAGVIWWEPSRPMPGYMGYVSNGDSALVKTALEDEVQQQKILSQIRDNATLDYANDVFDKVIKSK